MTKKVINKKTKIIIAITVAAGLFLAFVSGVIFFSFWTLFHTPKSVRTDMYNYYSDDANYVTVYGDAYFKIGYGDGMTVTITLSEECVQALNQTQNKRVYTTDKAYTYAIYQINHNALKENGFYGALNEVIKDNNTTYYRADKPITLIISDRMADRAAVAVSVAVGDKCYLD